VYYQLINRKYRINFTETKNIPFEGRKKKKPRPLARKELAVQPASPKPVLWPGTCPPFSSLEAKTTGRHHPSLKWYPWPAPHIQPTSSPPGTQISD